MYECEEVQREAPGKLVATESPLSSCRPGLSGAIQLRLLKSPTSAIKDGTHAKKSLKAFSKRN
jgi:hypothetical protein